MAPKRTAAALTSRNQTILSFFSVSSASPSSDSHLSPAKRTKTATSGGSAELFADSETEADRDNILTGLEPASIVSTQLFAESFRRGQYEHEASTDSSKACYHPVEGASMDSVQPRNLLNGDAIRPFEPLPDHTYICPFKVHGQCTKSQTFSSYRALAAHCNGKHKDKMITSINEDPLQDGTRKVPCPRACGSLFASYDAAMQHSKKCSLPSTTGFPRPCPWPECTELSADSRAYATHSASHVRDTRGLWQCSKCDDYWYDLYMLASHEMRCKGVDRERRVDACLRVVLGNIEQVSLIIIARSSSHAPREWYRGEEFVRDGIANFANDILDTVQEDLEIMGNCSAAFLALYDVHTSCVPTGAHSEAHKTQDPSIKSYLARAFKFTNAIDTELNAIAAREPDRPRFLLSVGIDGFACRADLVLKWLKRMPAFTLIIRETELVYGMKEEYFSRSDQGLYYAFFDSQDLAVSIETGVFTNRAIENLLEAWARVQAWKDDSASQNNGRTIGRNGNHRLAPKKAKRGPTGGPRL